MKEKRFFILRLNGNDICVLDNARDADVAHTQLIHNRDLGIKHEKTELNFYTTTYYYTDKYHR